MAKFGEREVNVGSVNDFNSKILTLPFATLVTASNQNELDAVLSIAASLVELGCKEFCCVGSDAELLHDNLDQLIEDAGSLDVVTTWHENTVEGCQYFLFAAGGQNLALLALISQHPETLKSMELAAN